MSTDHTQLSPDVIAELRDERLAELRADMAAATRRVDEALASTDDKMLNHRVDEVRELCKVLNAVRSASTMLDATPGELAKIIKRIVGAPRLRKLAQPTSLADVDAFLRDELGSEFSDTLPAEPAFAGIEALPERPRWCEDMTLADYAGTFWREIGQRDRIALWLRFGHLRWHSRVVR